MDEEEQSHNLTFVYPITTSSDIEELIERVEIGVRPTAILPLNDVSKERLRHALVEFEIVSDSVFIVRPKSTMSDYYDIQNVITHYNNVIGSLRKRSDYNCGFSLKKTIQDAFENPIITFAARAIHGYIDPRIMGLLCGHPLQSKD